MESKANDTNLSNASQSALNVIRKSESAPIDNASANPCIDQTISGDNKCSEKAKDSLVSKLESTPNTSKNTVKNAIPKTPGSQSVMIIKNLVNEVREMKERIRKLEDEVSTLHELLKVQDDITAETLAILPGNFEDTNKAAWNKRALPQHDFHKHDNSGSNSISQAMMMNNHAWYGDAFLFELMCQYKGYHPKEDNWFTSIYPFVAFETFSKNMFNRKRFYRSCVVCIGYSDLFNAKAVTGYPMKQTLHALLNYMNEHGADTIKVLSLPPARQMMKNVEYLKICQTTNKFFRAITKTHPFVSFINLDGLFIENADEFFTYLDNNTVKVQIRDNLLMRKVNDHFEIFVDPQTAKEVIEYVVDYRGLKGYQCNNNGNNETILNKRRSDSSPSPCYSAKRMNKSRSEDESFDDHCYRLDKSDRYPLNYTPKNPLTDYYEQDYECRDLRPEKISTSLPPWMKK